MDQPLTEPARHPEIREEVGKLCARFGAEYWRKLDQARGYPTEFVRALTEAGYLAVLIPEEYGGAGLGLSAASAILETIHAEGGNGAACHAQIYIMGTILRHGSAEQKSRYLPQIASGALRLQAFGVTEPTSGTDTTALRTFARREGDHYVVNGQKIWTSRAEHSDLMLLLARTTPRDQVARKTEGLSTFILDMREALGRGLTIRPIRTMMNHNSCEVFFDNVRVPAENLVGEEGRGFRYVLDGMNAERLLISSESIGDAKWFIAKSVAYARDRHVFGRPIGQNQGVQHPLAQCWAELKAAELMMQHAAALYDAGEPCGAEANAAKYLAAEACWRACETAVLTHGGFGYAQEYHVERYLREAQIARIAPVSPQLVLSYIAERVLGLPKSY
jgi:alkylation response protein AidB-like acyl-CoA dehydrogenase